MEDALYTIESLDDYFATCEDCGQGINSKESVQMHSAMDAAMAAGTSPLTLDSMVKSETAHRILARTDVVAGMRKLFGM